MASNTHSADPHQPEWETSKENVAPMRHGRSVPVLTAALTSSESELAAHRRAHENAVREAHRGTGPHAADPLTPWVLYSKWALDNYPAGSPLIISVVEKPCRLYAKDARYRDDSRFVRLWVRYADMRSDKLDVFDYMRRHRIGESAALFYEAWAATLEMARQYEKAEEVYTLGRDNRAKPVDRLAQREKEYFARMAARHRRAEKKKQEKQMRDLVGTARDAQRPVGTDQTAGRSQLADAVLSAPTDDQPEFDENGRKKAKRPALGLLSERQARTGHRPATTSAPAPLAARPIPRAAPRSNVPAQKLEVHVDMNEPAHVLAPQNDDELPPIPKRSKVEDDGPVLKWAGQTLPQNAKLKKRRLAVAPVHSATMHVYSGADEEVEEAPASAVARTGSIPLDASEALSVDENRPREKRTDENAARPVLGEILHTRSPEPRPAAAAKPRSVASPTINTKQALLEVDDAFNTTLPMERFRKERLSPKDDEAEHAGNRSPRVVPINRKAASGPLQICVDVEADKENAGGRRTRSHTSPSENALVEKRVLQPRPDLEGGPDAEVVVVFEDEGGEDSGYGGGDALMSSLGAWAASNKKVHMLSGDEPAMVHDMFDLELSDTDIVSLRPYHQFDGFRHKSRVFVAEDLNNVYKLQPPQDDGDDSDSESQGVVAVKVGHVADTNPPAMWEFYVYTELHRRIGKSLRGVPRALAHVESLEKYFLILDQISLGTLRDAVGLEKEGVLGELECMVLMADLLRTLELVHASGVVHGDVTMDNVMLRATAEALDEIRPYSAGGENNWCDVGVLLIDWNHAIDMRHESVGEAMEGVLRVAAAKGQDFRDAAYRTAGDGWGFNADCHGVAVCARDALGVTFDNVVRKGDELSHGKVWQSVFNKLTSVDALASAKESVAVMGECREMLENVLLTAKLLSLRVQTLFSNLEDAESAFDEDIAL